MDINIFFQEFERVLSGARQEEPLAFLRRSIAAAETENDEHALVTVLNEVAGYLRNTGRCAEAIEAAERALGLLRDMGYENSVSHGTTLLNAATAYRAGGNGAKAMQLFMDALSILLSTLPEDDFRLAGLYNNISSLHEEKGEWGKAFEMLIKAAAIMEKKTDMPGDAAIVLTNLGMVLFRLDRSDEALAALQKAEGMFLDEAGRGSSAGRPAPHYAAALAGMGEGYFRAGDYAGAAQKYEAAAEHIARAFGENRDYAVTCRNCAEACAAAGDEQKAALMAARAEAALKRLGLDG